MQWKYKERGTHYGVINDIMACMVAIGSSSSFSMLYYLLPFSCSTMEQYNNTINNGIPSLPSGLVIDNVLIAI